MTTLERIATLTVTHAQDLRAADGLRKDVTTKINGIMENPTDIGLWKALVDAQSDTDIAQCQASVTATLLIAAQNELLRTRLRQLHEMS